MKRLALCCLVLAGCSKQGALKVSIERHDLLVTHATLTVKGEHTLSTQCLAFASGKNSLVVGVAQHDFGADAELVAEGYADDTCTTVTHRADPVTQAFTAGKTLDVVLELNALTTPTETDCQNGRDDDQDGDIDCADSDCDGQSCDLALTCVEGRTCQQRLCQGGTQRACDTPPSCHLPGTCSEGTGCAYPVADAGTACDDADPCTDTLCNAAGTCVATPVVCDAPPAGACWKPQGTCAADGGCQYQPDVDAGCDDGDACTQDDRCGADAVCRGHAGACPARECMTVVNQCPGSGCQYSAVDAGTPCTNGTCNALGACLPTFVQLPSNVELSQVPPPASQAVVYGCNLTIDTGAGDAGAPSFNGGCGQVEPGWAIVTTVDNPSPVLVLSYADLSIQGTLTLTGSRPAIIVSTGTISVTGTILVQSGARTCVAGAGRDGAGSAGGGGAGFVTAGGRGGDENGGHPGGAGGGLDVTGALLGGCQGGIGGGNGTRAATGGGVLQLSAADQLVISGTIEAPGSGGAGGPNGVGGNGGGSGGQLIFEARRLEANTGSLTCNGGGGGARNGTAGAAGSVTLIPAAGGTGTGNGGNGATESVDAGDGASNGGGGGGGLGRVTINVFEGCAIAPQVLLSPAPSSNKLPDAGCGNR